MNEKTLYINQSRVSSEPVSIMTPALFEELLYKTLCNFGYSGNKEDLRKDLIKNKIIQKECRNLFPDKGLENSIYIDTKNNQLYYWKDNEYNVINIEGSKKDFYFDEDLIVSTDIGSIRIPQGENNIILKTSGKSVKEILTNLLSHRVPPEVVEPSIIDNIIPSGSLEVGSVINFAYEVKLDPGSYSFGPKTNITPRAWIVKDNSAIQNVFNSNEGFFSKILIEDNKEYKITITALYNKGEIPLDNLSQEYPASQIQSGVTEKTISFRGYRNFFYGVVETSSAEESIDSNLIRNLTHGGEYNSQKTISIKVSPSQKAKRIIIAYPSNTPRQGLVSAIMPNSLNYNAFIGGNYIKQKPIKVEGNNGYVPIFYDVWVYEPDLIDFNEEHIITLA
jgi:hypothetical protein